MTTPQEELAVAIRASVDTEVLYWQKRHEADEALTAWLQAERELKRIETEIKMTK